MTIDADNAARPAIPEPRGARPDGQSVGRPDSAATALADKTVLIAAAGAVAASVGPGQAVTEAKLNATIRRHSRQFHVPEELLRRFVRHIVTFGGAASGNTAVEPANQAMDGGTAPPAPSGELPPIGLHDLEAYDLHYSPPGLKQQAVAAALNRKYFTNYGQGQISRMLARARRYRRAQGLPVAGRQPGRGARAVDPARLDLGERTDGRPTDGRRSKRGADDE